MTDDLLQVVKQIALGRQDSGRPLAAETARQRCRKVLKDYGLEWADARTEQHPASRYPKMGKRRVPASQKRKLTPPAPTAAIKRYSKAKGSPRIVPNYRTGKVEAEE